MQGDCTWGDFTLGDFTRSAEPPMWLFIPWYWIFFSRFALVFAFDQRERALTVPHYLYHRHNERDTQIKEPWPRFPANPSESKKDTETMDQRLMKLVVLPNSYRESITLRFHLTRRFEQSKLLTNVTSNVYLQTTDVYHTRPFLWYASVLQTITTRRYPRGIHR